MLASIRRLSGYTDVILDAGMVLLALKYWLFPSPLDASAIHTFGVLMGFEFIMVHSGAMMGAVVFMVRAKPLMLGILACF